MTPRTSGRRRVVVFGILAATLLLAWSAGQATDAPSRIVLGVAADPTTSQPVTWRTASRADDAAAQVAIDDGQATPAAATVRLVTATSASVSLHTGQAVTHYAATLNGLTPATRYRYRVGAGGTWSAWQSFTTAAAQPAPFRFIYLGDAQNGLADAWPPVVRAAQRAASDARLVVHAGDLVAEGYDDALWAQWVAGLGALAASVPQMAVPGNHDEHRAPGTADPDLVYQVSNLWRAHLRAPANGPSELTDLAGQFYAVDYQGVRFIGLDANPFANDSYVKDQRDRVQRAVLAWLERQLKENPNRWTIVVQHQPLYPVAKTRDFPEMRTKLGALYDRYHVDLVLQGHDHAYARTQRLLNGAAASADGPGTIYAIAVSGSKMYAVNQPWAGLMATTVENTQTYQVISVGKDRLEYVSQSSDGRTIDRFALTKTAATAR